MALKINLTSGSVFAGNPITFTITPSLATMTLRPTLAFGAPQTI